MVVVCCGTNGLDACTPPTDSAYDGGADGGATNPYAGGGAPFLLIYKKCKQQIYQFIFIIGLHISLN